MSSSQQNSSSYLPSKAGTLAFIIFAVGAVVCAVICFMYRSRQDRIAAASAAATNAPLRTITAAARGLSKTEIASIPSFAYRCPVESGCGGGSCSRAGDAVVQCVICQIAMADGDTVKMLPSCRHEFHVVCIDKWLRLNSACPVCRTDAKPPPPPPLPLANSQASPPASVAMELPV